MIGEWGAAAGSQSLVHKLLVMVAYFEGVLYLLKFSIKVVGGGPTCQSLVLYLCKEK